MKNRKMTDVEIELSKTTLMIMTLYMVLINVLILLSKTIVFTTFTVTAYTILNFIAITTSICCIVMMFGNKMLFNYLNSLYDKNGVSNKPKLNKTYKNNTHYTVYSLINYFMTAFLVSIYVFITLKYQGIVWLCLFGFVGSSILCSMVEKKFFS